MIKILLIKNALIFFFFENVNLKSTLHTVAEIRFSIIIRKKNIFDNKLYRIIVNLNKKSIIYVLLNLSSNKNHLIVLTFLFKR